MAAPDLLHLLCKLTCDPDVPVKDRAMLAVAIAYFISPVDLIPEAVIGPIGYVDDIALAAYVLNKIVNDTNPEVVRRHWAGHGDVLVMIQEILKVCVEMVGANVWNALKAMVA